MSSLTGLTRAPAGGRGPIHSPDASPAVRPARRGRNPLSRLKFTAVLWAMMLPTLLSLLLFTYYPQFNTIRYSLYHWDGTDNKLEWIGLKNFLDAFRADPMFWQSFGLVLVLLAANVVKMWPSILTAIVLHRLRSERWQYVYRVLFVVPMIIPGIVTLLIWKSFFDAGTGALNALLNATGLMHLLKHGDYALAGLAASRFGVAVREQFVVGPMNGLWLIASLGAGMLIFNRLIARHVRRAMSWTGVGLIVATAVLALLTCAWPTKPLRAFDFGTPAWLGNQTLLIPSLIFWGFPWVGTVGVLIYLAGLQNISADVYEAAHLDGVGSIRRLTAIELPLILTQVRINLIFLTIGTITDYGLFFVLLGPTGGPGGRGMVPGLYMYQAAFIEQRYGYACALGMILFVLLLAITVLYQKYVKVEK